MTIAFNRNSDFLNRHKRNLKNEITIFNRLQWLFWGAINYDLDFMEIFIVDFFEYLSKLLTFVP